MNRRFRPTARSGTTIDPKSNKNFGDTKTSKRRVDSGNTHQDDDDDEYIEVEGGGTVQVSPSSTLSKLKLIPFRPMSSDLYLHLDAATYMIGGGRAV